MKALQLTNEYPPHIYGGAGVHIEYLSKELSKLMKVEVRCFGEQNENRDNLKIKGITYPEELLELTPDKLKSPLGALLRCINFNALPVDADVVHCHTWYTLFGGILCKLLYNIPLFITTHSLEPLRPWKREQLGTGYDFSLWLEKTAVQMADAIIAVSNETKADILKYYDVHHGNVHVISNGVDIEEYKHVTDKAVLDTYNIPHDMPYVLFVGRITRQKGIIHLINAIKYIDPDIGIVLCAGQPDTPLIAREMDNGIEEVRKIRNNVYWINKMVSIEEKVQLYSHAKVFCCPSIYEPFGIINIEAMACETPVVASKVGGIKEIVIPEETGLLIPFEQEKKPPFEALYPDKFARDLANAINRLIKDDDLNKKMAKAGRKRVEELYSWKAIAQKVLNLYKYKLEMK